MTIRLNIWDKVSLRNFTLSEKINWDRIMYWNTDTDRQGEIRLFENMIVTAELFNENGYWSIYTVAIFNIHVFIKNRKHFTFSFIYIAYLIFFLFQTYSTLNVTKSLRSFATTQLISFIILPIICKLRIITLVF